MAGKRIKNKTTVKAAPENIETEKLEGVNCNVNSIDFSWRIENFNVDCNKYYSVNFLLLGSIECSLGLFSTKDSYTFFKDGYHKELTKKNIIQPILFITSIANKEENYQFKLKMKSTGKFSSSFGIPFYEKLEVRPEGYKAIGPLITSKTIGNFLDRDGHLTLLLQFTLKEQEQCKPFDREDYTIERCALAKDMTKLFMSETCSDIVIVLGDDKIPAHKVVLAAHSSVLATMVENPEVTELKIHMIAPTEAYIELFRFMYNNTVKSLKPNLESLTLLADEYNVRGLKILCHLEIARAISIKYGKLTAQTQQVPPNILDDNFKALKFYKLLHDMDGLIHEKKYAEEPTPSSSKSSLETDEEPQTEQEVKTEEVDVQFQPTVELKQPEIPLQEALAHEEIFTTSMTDFFVTTLSPIKEQEEFFIESVEEIKVDEAAAAYDEKTDNKSEAQDIKVVEINEKTENIAEALVEEPQDEKEMKEDSLTVVSPEDNKSEAVIIDKDIVEIETEIGNSSDETLNDTLEAVDAILKTSIQADESLDTVKIEPAEEEQDEKASHGELLDKDSNIIDNEPLDAVKIETAQGESDGKASNKESLDKDIIDEKNEADLPKEPLDAVEIETSQGTNAIDEQPEALNEEPLDKDTNIIEVESLGVVKIETIIDEKASIEAEPLDAVKIEADLSKKPLDVVEIETSQASNAIDEKTEALNEESLDNDNNIIDAESLDADKIETAQEIKPEDLQIDSGELKEQESKSEVVVIIEEAIEKIEAFINEVEADKRDTPRDIVEIDVD